LKQLKCDEIQGYLFSKPLPAAQVKAKFLGAEI
jgi:EAL domain-containing protein (putative c-di-GMP-specific phosphodiesterase class I)